MRVKKHIKKLSFLLIAAYLAVLGYVYFAQRSLQYFPHQEELKLSGCNLGETTEVFLTTSDNIQLQTWYHPPQPGKPIVIFLHGNSYNLEIRRAKFREIIDMGLGFVAPAWRGFGASTGSPTEEGFYNDARAAIDFAKSMGYKTEESILIGESIGTGVATKMATENHFKGLFLITPYTSIADRAQEMYWYLPAHDLVHDNFSNLDKIAQINTALLIVHGDKDEVIPYQHSQKIFAAAHEPKKLVIYPGKGHNNLDNNEIFKEMRKFFRIENTEEDADSDAQD